MKVSISILMILAIGGILAAGFAVMDHDNMDHSDCIVALASGFNCAQASNAIGLAGLHAGFLSHLTNAVFADNVMLLLAFFLSLFLPSSVWNVQAPRFRRSHPISIRIENPGSRFEHWFSLLEHSPSFAYGRN